MGPKVSLTLSHASFPCYCIHQDSLFLQTLFVSSVVVASLQNSGVGWPLTHGSPFLNRPEVAGWAEAMPGKGAEVMDAHVLVV